MFGGLGGERRSLVPVWCVPMAGCVHEVRGWLGSGRSGDRTNRTAPPPPYLGRQDCVVVWLPTPPTMTTAYGQCLPSFVRPPPPRG